MGTNGAGDARVHDAIWLRPPLVSQTEDVVVLDVFRMDTHGERGSLRRLALLGTPKSLLDIPLSH